MLVANGEIKSSFELKVDDLAKQRKSSSKVQFDSDGSLITRGGEIDVYYFWRRAFENTKKPQEDSGYTLKYDLHESVTLSILNVLLLEKKNRRQFLIDQLIGLGVRA